MIRLLKFAAAALGLLVLGLFLVLAEAHVEMRQIVRELPTRAQLDAVSGGADGPVRVRYANSGTQAWPEGRRGTYGGFVIDWPDGRSFAIDAGMRQSVTIEFARTLEIALGAGPVEAYASLPELLGDDASRIAGVAFTHLHNDHTDGIRTLCDARGDGRAVPAFQVPDQFSRGNFGTFGSKDLEAAACVERRELQGGPLFPIPGFPGLAAFGVGGHTPGSTVFVAKLGGTRFVFAGDVSNAFENLKNDVPKELIYSWLIVPENRPRLAELRPWLSKLDDDPSYTVVVSHDLDRIVEAGIVEVGR